MQIEIHEFFSAAPMTDKNLEELIKILKIPLKLYKVDRHHRTREVSRLKFYFGTNKQGEKKLSVEIKAGIHDSQLLLNPVTGAKCERGYSVPAGFVSYRPRVSVELHGSFFDNSPDFNFGELLSFMQGLDHKPTHLDVAHNDDQGVTTLADWLPVFENYSTFCLGNAIKKAKITPQISDGIFDSVHIGSASSKTAYGTLYQRPEFLRLEMKYRSTDVIHQLLSFYDEEDREEFNAACMRELVTNLNIVTAASKRTRNPDKYVRMPFWQKFLDSEPEKVSRKEMVEAKRAAREVSVSEKYQSYIKKTAGYLDNLWGKYGDSVPVETLIADLKATKPALGVYFV